MKVQGNRGVPGKPAPGRVEKRNPAWLWDTKPRSLLVQAPSGVGGENWPESGIVRRDPKHRDLSPFRELT